MPLASPAQRLSELIEEGTRALEAKSAALAIEKLSAAVALAPKRYLRIRLSKALALDDQLAEAEREAAIAVSEPRPSSKLLLHLSNIRRQIGKTAEALEAAKRAAQTDPASANAEFACGRLLAELGRYPEASGAVDAANRKSDRPRAEWLLFAGNLHRRLGDLPEALALAEKAMEIEPSLITRARIGDLKARIEHGGNSSEATVVYYDIIYNDNPAFVEDGPESLYLPVWIKLVSVLREAGVSSVLDIGCGPGKFAKFLTEQMPGTAYLGVDFSSAAIDIAREKCPQQRFEQGDITTLEAATLDKFGAIICTEVLEHIETDVELLERLPAGMRFLGSVPNFDSFGHVRFFADAAAVTERYGKMFSELSVEDITINGRSRIFLMSGTLA
jgi:tetratricopeptide (TPR) repeat protein